MSQGVSAGEVTKGAFENASATVRVESIHSSIPSPSLSSVDVDTFDQTIIPFSMSGELVPDIGVVQEFLMRALDLVGALVLLGLSMPILLLAVVGIRLTSPGAAIYRQKRVGRKGGVFTLFKLRSMVEDAEEVWGFKPACPEDERITKVGNILRRTRVDEIPQLINVLKGEMSLVGPRPENLYRVRTYKSLRGVRLAVKPGITGLAQIRSLYDVKPAHKLKYDYLYIQNRSFFLNLYILAKTIPVVIQKSGW